MVLMHLPCDRQVAHDTHGSGSDDPTQFNGMLNVLIIKQTMPVGSPLEPLFPRVERFTHRSYDLIKEISLLSILSQCPSPLVVSTRPTFCRSRISYSCCTDTTGSGFQEYPHDPRYFPGFQNSYDSVHGRYPVLYSPLSHCPASGPVSYGIPLYLGAFTHEYALILSASTPYPSACMYPVYLCTRIVDFQFSDQTRLFCRSNIPKIHGQGPQDFITVETPKLNRFPYPPPIL